ncbi:CRISPR system precrRNA processing endoribonuclease RAMP protein Cas6 [Candidatus Desulfosporosinus nitrosoreducens]|uniref:CRISPR system precrRNA processing endoribonuclease RAMP protein Cas6 n=1 Tax=Candidatus Desulfosporosinus nitrosoreducens TaxID=3401928 RepID=UPI0035AB8857
MDALCQPAGLKIDFSGLTRSMRLQGELSTFVSWHYAAQILHVGRNTTFGVGEIEVEFTGDERCRIFNK